MEDRFGALSMLPGKFGADGVIIGEDRCDLSHITDVTTASHSDRSPAVKNHICSASDDDLLLAPFFSVYQFCETISHGIANMGSFLINRYPILVCLISVRQNDCP